MSELQLKIGKRYVTRSGQMTAPLEPSQAHSKYEYPFVDPVSCITYTANGSYESYRTGKHTNDLVLEVLEKSESKSPVSFWEARCAALAGFTVKKINSDLVYTAEDFSVTSEFYFSTGEMAEDWIVEETKVLRTFYFNVYTNTIGGPKSSLKTADASAERHETDRKGCVQITVDENGQLVEARNV